MRINKLILVISFAVFAIYANKQALSADKAATPQKQEKAAVPAAGSKFAKLKLGMTKKQVVALIGTPDNEVQHPTAKISIPFYHGDDRWVLECSYKKEGTLTFNYGGDQALNTIVVNTSE